MAESGATADAVAVVVHEAGEVVITAAQRVSVGMSFKREFGVIAGRREDVPGVRDRTAAAYGPDGIHCYNADMFPLELSTGGGRGEGVGGAVLSANDTSEVYDNSGMLGYEPTMAADRVDDAFAHQATGAPPPVVAAAGGDKLAGALPLGDHVRRALGVVGVATASLAATGLAAGTATPAVGFGLFTVLLCSLLLVIVRVRGA
ncbi:hypothetical protein E2562_000450 [Oryza meyeriana var. granulata]|uniref:Uncharacterized protein n=1 Tax=Oryza meyeriana var. granulata TaxID=110450 RepID=A0A6G1CB92_9ORYZ|nr:hypothetical protein E2562_000450 [Oryza meyeriana var. granulata]